MARFEDASDARSGDGVRVVRAPGRVNLIGDHTDYCEGWVLPLAIDRECLVAARPAGTAEVTARSREVPGEVRVPVDGSADPATVEPPWGRYVAGVVATLVARDMAVPGLELSVSSAVPAGSGLSSSAALTVALVDALAGAAAHELSAIERARTARDAEARATGVETGIMDQLTSVAGVEGHALLIDCRTLTVEPIPIPSSLGILVVHSGIARRLATSEYGRRHDACAAAARHLGLTALRDASLDQVRDTPLARHVVTENERVLAAADALRTSDAGALGRLLLASHASLRDDFEVSTPELDRLVELLCDAGALGARLTGAGFGGCVVALVQRNHVDDVAAKSALAYHRETGREPMAFAVRAVEGAGPVGPTSARAVRSSWLRTLRA